MRWGATGESEKKEKTRVIFRFARPPVMSNFDGGDGAALIDFHGRLASGWPAADENTCFRGAARRPVVVRPR